MKKTGQWLNLENRNTRGLVRAVSLGLVAVMSVALLAQAPTLYAKAPATAAKAQTNKTKPKPAADTKAPDKAKDAADKDKEKAEAPKPEPPIENVVNVTTEELVNKPFDYLKKNVKFQAKFSAFGNLALDYKSDKLPIRKSKDYLSFTVFKGTSHIPFSELKLAMPIPKDKDPKSTLLQGLKDGDTIEVIGNVFGIGLDEPYVDVLRLTKIASAPDDKKASATDEKR